MVAGSGHFICLSVPILPRGCSRLPYIISHHAVSCRHGGDIDIRHNILHDIIADLCRKAHLSVRVEAGHGMCRDNNHSRPADVLVEGWERGQRTCCPRQHSHFSPHSSLLERVK